MTGPKIQVGADLSGLTAELNRLQQQMRGLETACANLGSGLDKGPLKKNLASLNQQADALSAKLGEQIDMGRLNPAELNKIATAFDGIGKAAGKVEGQLYGKGGTTTAWMGKQAQYGRQEAQRLTQLDTLQDTLAKKGRRRSLDELRDIEERGKALLKHDPRFKTAYRGKTLQDLAGGDWHVYKDDLKSKRLLNDFYQAAGIDPQTRKPGFVRTTVGRVGGAVAQALPGGNILTEATKAGESGEGTGAMAFGKALGPAALAYGAYKLVSSLVGKYGDAKDQAINVGFLTHAVQGSASDFDRLSKAIDKTADTFGASREEVAALSSQYAKTAGTLSMGDVGQGGGFARAYGINPAAMGQFLATGRLSGASRNDSESKRLALYIGEAVSRSGATPKMEEFLAVAGSFLQHTAQSSLASPNAAAYLDLLGSMTGKGSAPGLLGNPMNAGSLIMQADAATRRGGTSEASHTFWLGALMNGIPGINAFDAPTQLQGGLFGTPDEAFGPNSAMYKMADKMHDKSMLAHLSGMKGGKNNLEILWGFGKHHAGGKSRYMTEILKSTMGLDDRQAQNFFNSVETMGGPGKVAGKLKAQDINIDNLDFTKDGAKIAKLMGLASGDRGSLMDQAKHLQTLPNLPEEVEKSLKNAGELSKDELQKLVIATTNTYDIFKNTGDAALYVQKQMDNKLGELVEKAIPPLTKISESILKVVAFFQGISVKLPDLPENIILDTMFPGLKTLRLLKGMGGGEGTGAGADAGADAGGDAGTGSLEGYSPGQQEVMGKIVAEAKRQGASPSWALALAKKESAFFRHAVGPQTTSGRGHGIYQFMEGSSQGWNRDDVDQNIQHGIANMKAVHDKAVANGFDDETAWKIAAGANLTGPNITPRQGEWYRKFSGKNDTKISVGAFMRQVQRIKDGYKRFDQSSTSPSSGKAENTDSDYAQQIKEANQRVQDLYRQEREATSESRKNAIKRAIENELENNKAYEETYGKKLPTNASPQSSLMFHNRNDINIQLEYPDGRTIEKTLNLYNSAPVPMGGRHYG